MELSSCSPFGEKGSTLLGAYLPGLQLPHLTKISTLPSTGKYLSNGNQTFIGTLTVAGTAPGHTCEFGQ